MTVIGIAFAHFPAAEEPRPSSSAAAATAAGARQRGADPVTSGAASGAAEARGEIGFSRYVGGARCAVAAPWLMTLQQRRHYVSQAKYNMPVKRSLSDRFLNNDY